MFAKLASYFWLGNILLTILSLFLEYQEIKKKEVSVRLRQEDEKQKSLDKQKLLIMLKILQQLGDSVTASQGCGIPSKLLGFDFHDGQMGSGGTLSAVIGLYLSLTT